MKAGIGKTQFSLIMRCLFLLLNCIAKDNAKEVMKSIEHDYIMFIRGQE